MSYPAIPALSADCKELTLDVDVLVNGINKTIFATADDELRPVMNGVYINLAPSMLTFVGTDAHKLVKYEVETANEVASSFILPRSRPTCSNRCCSRRKTRSKVSFDSKNAMFQLKKPYAGVPPDRRQLPELQCGDSDRESQ